VPRPAELLLVKDGVRIASELGSRLDFDARASGVYRVEARLRGKTWILSNPIYLR
jgi:hypothetical protein